MYISIWWLIHVTDSYAKGIVMIIILNDFEGVFIV